MSTYFVTRHAGALDWAKRHGIAYDVHVRHIGDRCFGPGDIVIGSLPVHIVARICRQGAGYFNVSVDVPEAARGTELSVEDLDRFGARLEAFLVIAPDATEASRIELPGKEENE